MMGIGPLLGWRRTSREVMVKQFTWPLLAALRCRHLFFLQPTALSCVGLSHLRHGVGDDSPGICPRRDGPLLDYR